MEPYRRYDGKGGWLEVRGIREGDPAGAEGCVVTTGPQGFVTDPVMDVPAITERLREACGLLSPVILERPAPRDTLVPGPHGDEHVTIAPSPAGRPSNAPGVTLVAGGVGIRLVGDEPLRVALALIDAMREAEAEPTATLRRAVSAMRSDAERCGDKPGSFVVEVADWLDIEIAALERKLPDDSGSVHVALRISRAYLGEGSGA